MNRLLVCAPLRIEARAVRRGLGPAGDVRRTGYGPREPSPPPQNCVPLPSGCSR